MISTRATWCECPVGVMEELSLEYCTSDEIGLLHFSAPTPVMTTSTLVVSPARATIGFPMMNIDSSNHGDNDVGDTVEFSSAAGINFRASRATVESPTPPQASLMEAQRSPYLPYLPPSRNSETPRSPPRFSISEDPYNAQSEPEPLDRVLDRVMPEDFGVEDTDEDTNISSFPPPYPNSSFPHPTPVKSSHARRSTRAKIPRPTQQMTGESVIQRRGPSAQELAEAPTDRARSALQTWYNRLHQLEAFRRQFGHCAVPQKYEENRQLGIWYVNDNCCLCIHLTCIRVNKQRMEKKFMDQGKRTSMTPHKVRALEAIGFTWAKLKGQASWDAKFEELQVYHHEYGNCNVPTKYRLNRKSVSVIRYMRCERDSLAFVRTAALGRWVSTQRSQYKEFMAGIPGHMTQDRFDRLESLGFRWNMMEDTLVDNTSLPPPRSTRSGRRASNEDYTSASEEVDSLSI